jgi:hypothetical protein
MTYFAIMLVIGLWLTIGFGILSRMVTDSDAGILEEILTLFGLIVTVISAFSIIEIWSTGRLGIKN